MPRSRIAHLTVLLLAVVVTAGCHVVRAFPPGWDKVPAWYAPPEERDEMYRVVEEIYRDRTAGPIHILVLSGGGANGAWGAGVLGGWRASEGVARPDFRLVTGISAGALIATFAFLNEEKYDRLMERFCTTAGPEEIYETRSFFMIPFSSSLALTDPLKHLLETYLTDEVIDAVARRAPTGAKLLVATVDLDVGFLKMWDLTKIAGSDAPTRYALYRRIVLAAASVPVFFPPVEIDGHLHVDGGLRQQLFLRDTLAPMYEQRPSAWGQTATERGGVQAVYVIVNGKVGVPKRCVDERIAAIGSRAMEIAIDESLVANLHAVEKDVRAVGARFRISRIPRDYPLGDDSFLFDKDAMLALYRAGYEWGRTGSWETRVPEPAEGVVHEENP